MGFFGNSNSDQPQPDVELIMSFLNEMAMAQSKRFDALSNQIEELKKEVLRLQELQKNAVVSSVPTIEEKVVPTVVAQPVSQPPVQAPSTVHETEAEPATPPRTISYPPLVYGSPDGAGFEASDNLSGRDDNRALYVVERISDTEANFYPLVDKFHRLRSNASSFFLPLCNVSGNLDSATTIEVVPAGYGKLKLTDGYWGMIEKCSVNCL